MDFKKWLHTHEYQSFTWLNTTLFFRRYSTKELMELAANELTRWRSCHQRDALEYSGPFLTAPRLDEYRWGDTPDQGDINPEDLIVSITGPPPERNGTDRNRIAFFCTAGVKNAMCIPSDTPIRAVCPTSAPLLDMLVTLRQARPGWQFPVTKELKLFQENRGQDLKVLSPINGSLLEVKELTIGASNDTKVQEVMEFIEAKLKDNETTFPSQGVAMHLQEIAIDNNTINNLLDKAGTNEAFTSQVIIPADDTTTQNGGEASYSKYPARLLIGDGLRWAVSIRWPAIKTGIRNGRYQQYKLLAAKPSNAVIQLLNSLPTPIGINIVRQTQIVQEWCTSANPEYLVTF